jgi:haloalkane dehalogenase
MEALRTPDAAFAAVPDFDFPVEYADDLPGYEGLRMAFIDTGPADAARTFLACMASRAGRFSIAR